MSTTRRLFAAWTGRGLRAVTTALGTVVAVLAVITVIPSEASAEEPVVISQQTLGQTVPDIPFPHEESAPLPASDSAQQPEPETAPGPAEPSPSPTPLMANQMHGSGW